MPIFHPGGFSAVTASIIPSADSTFDIGSGSLEWATVFADKFTTTGTGTYAGLTLTNNDSVGTLNEGVIGFSPRAAIGHGGSMQMDSANNLNNTSGGASIVHIGRNAGSAITPASGTGSFAMLAINPQINGTSSGTAYGLGIASKTNVLTGGTIKLASFGTTTTDLFTGYTEGCYISTLGSLVPGVNGVPYLGAAALGWAGLYLDYTNTATVGAVTINKASGRAIIATGASSVVITNSMANAASHAFASLQELDTTALYIRAVICGANTITIHTTANATADTEVNWVLINPD